MFLFRLLFRFLLRFLLRLLLRLLLRFLLRFLLRLFLFDVMTFFKVIFGCSSLIRSFAIGIIGSNDMTGMHSHLPHLSNSILHCSHSRSIVLQENIFSLFFPIIGIVLYEYFRIWCKDKSKLFKYFIIAIQEWYWCIDIWESCFL